MAQRRKTRTKKDDNIVFLQKAVDNQGRAYKDGPKMKNFTLHDLRSVKPLTFGQQQLFEAYFDNNTIVANGSAGTGKSFSAVYLALTDLLKENSDYSEIIIVRSAVASREVGHLPGELDEKIAPYEEPYRDIFGTLLRKHDAYDTMKENGKVRFMCTSFVRGLTWDNAIVIVDEVQSMTFHEINSVITRLGDNSRLVICGDIAQNDLITKKNDQSGYVRALSAFRKMRSVEIVDFTRDDIVRSAFVKEWICAVEDTSEM